MSEILVNIIGIIISIIALWKGADFLIENSYKVAKKHNISESIIGLTILAFGTSLPEFLVSLSAALMGSSNISIGNVIGSNIFNLGFILGLTALIHPIKIKKDILYRDIPFFIISSLVFIFLALDKILSRLDGLILLTLFGIFIFVLLKTNSSFQEEEEIIEIDKNPKVSFFTYLAIGLSLGALIFFSKLLVTLSKDLALKLGISDWIIGSTIVALGTSFPEFVTSLAATLKKRYSMSIGNILGSNIFNICLVLGSASLVSSMNVKKEAILGSFLLTLLGIYLFFVGYKYKKLSRFFAFILFTLGVFSYFKILK